jgi:DNA-binding CsgD family transcriptional regulator
MKPGKRFGLSGEEKSDVWRRWKEGQTLHEIGRAFGKEHSSIRCLVSRHGGIAPAVRRRALLALTLLEREEISRGLASGSSIREIAKCLERAVSTVSSGGRTPWWTSCVSSQSSGRRSLAVRLAAQALPSFHPPEVAEHRCE